MLAFTFQNFRARVDVHRKENLGSTEKAITIYGQPENCTNACNQIKAIKEVCLEKGLGLHLDGARLFNALIESGDTPEEYGQCFDSISICLSKGLGAPVGSVLLGSEEFIQKAHRIRKVLGGGMRQAGSLAAAASYALDNNVEELKRDHAKARSMADALRNIDRVKDILPVETNIVIFELADAEDAKRFLEQLNSMGILAAPFGAKHIRFVAHLDVTEEHMDHLLNSLKNLE